MSSVSKRSNDLTDEGLELPRVGERMRRTDPALQVRDPEADGDQEKPQDGGSVLGMAGGDRAHRTVVNGRAPRPSLSLRATNLSSPCGI